MISDELETALVSAIALVGNTKTGRVGIKKFGDFVESADGYPGVEQAFDDAVQIATRFWGRPAKVAHGLSSARADVHGVPADLLDSRVLRYALWQTPEVLACIAMLTHDADTIRSFELTWRVPPGKPELVQALATAARRAFTDLFARFPGQYYYCALVVHGSAARPFITAWSREALKTTAAKIGFDEATLTWSYADSPYCVFGEEHFAEVYRLFDQRGAIHLADDLDAEFNFRLDAMTEALAQLDHEGLFGRGPQRDEMIVNAEVQPPDWTNTARAKALNRGPALEIWLRDVAEPP